MVSGAHGLVVDGERERVRPVLEESFLPSAVLPEIDPQRRIPGGQSSRDFVLLGPAVAEQALPDGLCRVDDARDLPSCGLLLERPFQPAHRRERRLTITGGRFQDEHVGAVSVEPSPDRGEHGRVPAGARDEAERLDPGIEKLSAGEDGPAEIPEAGINRENRLCCSSWAWRLRR